MSPVLLTALLLAAPPSPAGGAHKRVALLVAHPFGGAGLDPLRYTGHDLERMREVLTTLGEVSASDLWVSFGEEADDLLARFADARERVRQYRAQGHSTLFLFYYSGHAKDDQLRLGETRLPLDELKRQLDSTAATVRLAWLDSCRTGSITRLKGARKGAPVAIALEEASIPRGLVLITAASADEDAQESDELQGSFFTHFLTSGLRGAADQNGDGAVSLAEVYAYAYAGTVARTAGTRGGVQHPTYRFDLRGAGDLLLTRPAQASAILFPESLHGRFLVFATRQRAIIAELDKEAGQPARLAVAPGEYVVKKRETDHLRLLRLSLARGEVRAIDESTMDKVAFADDYAKGAVITTEEVILGRLGLTLSATVGAQTFLSAPARGDFFPNLGLLQLNLDLDNAVRRNLGVRFDLGLGGSDEQTLVLEDPYLGELRYGVQVSQVTVGVALTCTWPWRDWLRFGAHTRLGFVSIHRLFDGGLPEQSFATLTPGFGVEGALRLRPWLYAGLRGRVHYMFFNVDRDLSLAYVDGGLFLTAVLR